MKIIFIVIITSLFYNSVFGQQKAKPKGTQIETKTSDILSDKKSTPASEKENKTDKKTIFPLTSNISKNTNSIYSRFNQYFAEVVDAFGVDADDYKVKLLFMSDGLAKSIWDTKTNQRYIYINANFINSYANTNDSVEKIAAFVVLAHEFSHQYFGDNPQFLDEIKENRADFYAGSILNKLDTTSLHSGKEAIVFFVQNEKLKKERIGNFQLGFNREDIFRKSKNQNDEKIKSLKSENSNLITEIDKMKQTIKSQEEKINIEQTKIEQITKDISFINNELSTLKTLCDDIKNNDSLKITTLPIIVEINRIFKLNIDCSNDICVCNNLPNSQTTSPKIKDYSEELSKLKDSLEKSKKNNEVFKNTLQNTLQNQGIIISKLNFNYQTRYDSLVQKNSELNCEKFIIKTTQVKIDTLTYTYSNYTFKVIPKQDSTGLTLENNSVEVWTENNQLKYYRNIKVQPNFDKHYPYYFKVSNDKYLIDACGSLWLSVPKRPKSLIITAKELNETK